MAHGPAQQASVGEGISAGTGGGSSSWLIPDHTIAQIQAQAEGSPGEAQAVRSRCAHTAQQCGSAPQAQPQTHRSSSTFSSGCSTVRKVINLFPLWIPPFFQTPFSPSNCCLPVHHSSSSKSPITHNSPHNVRRQQPKELYGVSVLFVFSQ